MSWLLLSPVNLQNLTPMSLLPTASLRVVVLRAHRHRLPDQLLWRLLLGVCLVQLLLVVWQYCDLHFSDMHRNHWHELRRDEEKSYRAVFCTIVSRVDRRKPRFVSHSLLIIDLSASSPPMACFDV